MKKILIVYSAFILPNLLILVLINIVFLQVPNNFKTKFEYIESVDFLSVELIYLGSSHTLLGLNPDKSKFDALNLSNNSQSIRLDLEIMEKILSERKSQIRYVVMELSFFSLGYDFNSNERWREDLYDHYLRGKYIYLADHPNLLSSLKAIIDYFIINQYEYKTTVRGYQEPFVQMNTEMEFIEDSEYKSNIHNTNSSTIYAKNYLKLIELLNEHQIEVILHVPPMTRYYLQNIAQNQKSQIEMFLKKIELEYPNVLISDNASMFQNQLNMFKDSNHLNITGADLYTKHIDSLIINRRLLIDY